MHPFAPSSAPIVGLIDIGTAKIACLILSVEDRGTGTAAAHVIGFGHQKSRGLKASVIVDADAAADALRATVSQAEHMAGVVLQEVVMAVSCGQLGSRHLTTGRELATGSLTPGDLDAMMAAGQAHAASHERAALHIEILSTRVDDRPVADASIGSRGAHAALDLNVVSADLLPLRQTLHVAERCQLHVRAVAPAALTSALAATTSDERAQGVIAVDFGAGTTSVAYFAHDKLVAAHVVPIGSNHLTYDLTRTLGTTLNEAERIKKSYAIDPSARRLPVSHPHFEDAFTYRPRDDSDALPKQVTRATITTTLTSRIDALLAQIGQRLERTRVPAHLFGRITLTGGGSLLPLVAERAAHVLARPVRLAPPWQADAWPHMLLQPAFATLLGLRDIALDAALGLHHAPVPVPIAAPAPMRHLRQAGG